MSRDHNTLEKSIQSVAEILDELEGLGEQCAEGLLRVKELERNLKSLEERLSELLPADSAVFRMFDRGKREIGPWWQISHTGYVEHSHCEKLAKWRELV